MFTNNKKIKELENQIKILKDQNDEIEAKLDVILDTFGFKSKTYIFGQSGCKAFSSGLIATKWNALLKHLGIEWTEETKEAGFKYINRGVLPIPNMKMSAGMIFGTMPNKKGDVNVGNKSIKKVNKK